MTGGPVVAVQLAPAENNYQYDNVLEIRAVGGSPSVHIEITTAGGTEDWWLSEWRAGVASPAYGGRPGAMDVWLSRREIPIPVEREQWAALAYDLEAIRDELRVRIVEVFDEEFSISRPGN